MRVQKLENEINDPEYQEHRSFIIRDLLTAQALGMLIAGSHFPSY